MDFSSINYHHWQQKLEVQNYYKIVSCDIRPRMYYTGWSGLNNSSHNRENIHGPISVYISIYLIFCVHLYSWEIWLVGNQFEKCILGFTCKQSDFFPASNHIHWHWQGPSIRGLTNTTITVLRVPASVSEYGWMLEKHHFVYMWNRESTLLTNQIS